MQLTIFPEPVVRSRTESLDRLEVLFGFKVPLDGLMSAILSEKTIDIVALDSKLCQAHGCGYDEDRESMRDFVTRVYGEEAASILKSL